MGVERHEDASLRGGMRQQLLVRAAVEDALLVDGTHVVPVRPQSRADTPSRDVGVQQ